MEAKVPEILYIDLEAKRVVKIVLDRNGGYPEAIKDRTVKSEPLLRFLPIISVESRM